MDFFVYTWTLPDTGAIFYVGKGRRRRDATLKTHNPHFMRVIGKLKATGFQPIISRVREGLTEHDAFRIERELIASVRSSSTGDQLCNLTDGGEGASGFEHTPETRAKMSAAKSGVPKSDQTRSRIAAAKRGVPRSDQTKSKLRIANLGKSMSRETREKIATSLSGRVFSDEHRARQSASAKKAFQSADAKARVAAGLRMAGPRSDNKSGLKGVRIDKSGRSIATIRTDGRPEYLGYFKTPKEAAEAYDEVAFAAWGSDCYLNYPQFEAAA